jgi:hypothetical protein
VSPSSSAPACGWLSRRKSPKSDSASLGGKPTFCALAAGATNIASGNPSVTPNAATFFHISAAVLVFPIFYENFSKIALIMTVFFRNTKLSRAKHQNCVSTLVTRANLPTKTAEYSQCEYSAVRCISYEKSLCIIYAKAFFRWKRRELNSRPRSERHQRLQVYSDFDLNASPPVCQRKRAPSSHHCQAKGRANELLLVYPSKMILQASRRTNSQEARLQLSNQGQGFLVCVGS